MRSGAAVPNLLGRIEWGAAASFLLGFALVAYLGLEGGGYDALIHDQVGVVVWWLLLAGVVVGAMPRQRFGPLGWAALGLLAAFVLWTALSLSWTDSPDQTWDDLARVCGYLGAFALALCCHDSGSRRFLLGGVVAGVCLVAAIALISRFHPVWFPDADQTAQLLRGNHERLSYPVQYWNGLAALMAIGLPLTLMFASSARTRAVRSLAAAALPLLMLTSYLTFSRAGIGTAIIALAVFVALAADRLPKLLTLGAAAIGGAVLCLGVASRDALHDGLVNSTAESQGDAMIVWAIVVCLLVAAAQLGITALMDEGRRPSWTRVPRRNAQIGLGVAAAVLLVALIAGNAPGRASDAWDEFKTADGPGESSGRLTSAAGENRYVYWSSAVDENATAPLIGTGSGTFEFWWTQDREADDVVQDTHSLYFQTLGEVGIVGLLVLVAFALTILIGAGRGAVRARSPGDRTLLAAALASCFAFFLAAAVDWLWQIPVLACAMLLVAAAAVGPGARGQAEGEQTGGGALPLAWRAGAAALCLVAIVLISMPLAATNQLRDSEADVREGDLTAALAAARSAQNALPGAAAPRLQQALVLELGGDLPAASEAARAATEREQANWRNWLVLSRIEAQRGNADAALAAYRKAKSLNPLSPLFDT